MLSDEARAEAASRLRWIVGEFQDELADKPTLAEFLEILSYSVPRGEFIGGLSSPLRVTAELVGRKRYASRQRSRVSELNDAVFVEASEWLSLLAEAIVAASGRPASADELATAVLAVLNTSGRLLRRCGRSRRPVAVLGGAERADQTQAG